MDKEIKEVVSMQTEQSDRLIGVQHQLKQYFS
jgi:hypothetical protein